MGMQITLHLKYYIDILNVSRIERDRGLARIEDASMKHFRDLTNIQKAQRKADFSGQ